MTKKPEYLDRFPCHGCGCGYLDCVSYAKFGSKCCKDCAHPERFTTPNAYSAEELSGVGESQ